MNWNVITDKRCKQQGRVSPRTNSHSKEQSGSQSSSSPIDKSRLSPQQISTQGPVGGIGAGVSGAAAAGLTPKAINTESHNLKTARMEAIASPGFGGGIPAKIDEEG